jgi:signal transduction histidine kinase
MSVSLNHRLARLAFRPHLPRRTVRLRLTMLYGGLFLLSGAALLAITYLLVVNATRGFIFTGQNGVSSSFVSSGHHATHSQQRGFQLHLSGGPRLTPQQAKAQALQLQAQSSQQHASVLHQLLIQSGIALAAMTVLSIGLGWIVAGRVLRPLRTITTTAREISASNLDERLALDGPDDELKDLGDTFDELLARLDGSFQAQRRFVANASHELRTPLALNRAMLQVALADPDLTLESLRSTCEEALDAGKDHEQLIEALLMLARSQRGIDHRETLDLGHVADDVVQAHEPAAAAHRVIMDAALHPAPVSGDPRLTQRLVSNLVENALRYNTPGGHVHVSVHVRERRAILAVANTGPEIPAEEIDRLLQPFQRLAPYRGTVNDGHGLGLSIVAAIADAHGATLNVQPRPGGGLHVEISFPVSPTTPVTNAGARPTRTATTRRPTAPAAFTQHPNRV